MTVILDLPTVHFGFGSITEIASSLRSVGMTRPLIVTDAGVLGSGAVERVQQSIAGTKSSLFAGVTEPPTSAGVDAAFAVYRAQKCDGIIAVGGGSVIDTAKMACVLATHGGIAETYVGFSDRIVGPIAPLIVVPTTAGSGSEVSPSTGIHPTATAPGMRTRAPGLVPKITICDPELTLTMPPRLTAVSGLDALTHCIEGYLASTPNPIIDAIALSGIAHVMAGLEAAIADGANRAAREAMMLGALEGGISIAKGLGPAHAMATAFSHWPVPHGLLAALSLAPSLTLIAEHAPDRMARIALAMGIAPGTSAVTGFRDLLGRVHGLTGLPMSLSAAGCTNADNDALAAASHASPVNRTSPYHPSQEEYRRMIDTIIG